MRTAIDAAGRIVVPKALRDALHLAPGQAIDIAMIDGALLIEIPPTPMHLLETPDGPVASADVPVPPLSADLVRDVLEQTRR